MCFKRKKKVTKLQKVTSDCEVISTMLGDAIAVLNDTDTDLDDRVEIARNFLRAAYATGRKYDTKNKENGGN